MSNTISVLLEPTQPMSCSTSNNYQDRIDVAIDDDTVASINETFELSSQDISLVSIKLYNIYLLCDCKTVAQSAHDEILGKININVPPNTFLIQKQPF